MAKSTSKLLGPVRGRDFGSNRTGMKPETCYKQPPKPKASAEEDAQKETQEESKQETGTASEKGRSTGATEETKPEKPQATRP